MGFHPLSRICLQFPPAGKGKSVFSGGVSLGIYTMSWSMTLIQSWVSVLMSVASVTIEGPEDVRSLDHHIWLCWCPRNVPP